MAKITIDVPDNTQAGWLFNGLAKQWNYEETDSEGNPNPETKEDFLNRILSIYLKTEAIRGYMKDKHLDLVALADQVQILVSKI